MKQTIVLVFIILTLSATCQAADLHKTMYGWTDSHGTYHEGVLAMEGVSKKNPLGKQNLKSDPGNYRKGKNCGGTVAGICCRDNPTFPFKTATLDDVVRHYGNNEWKHVHGNEIISQYLAYKMTRMAILMGKETAVKLIQRTINDMNGKAKDTPVTGVFTADDIRFLNEITAPQKSADGTENHWRRWCFFEHLKLIGLDRCGDLIKANPKLGVFWENWSGQMEKDIS